LFLEYETFCTGNNIKGKTKGDFYTQLKDVNIIAKKIQGNFYYKYSFEELKEIADKEQWLCEYDDIEENTEQDEFEIDKLENTIEQLTKENEKLTKEKEKLKNRKEEYKKSLLEEQTDNEDLREANTKLKEKIKLLKEQIKNNKIINK